jgi:hypothetical protein
MLSAKVSRPAVTLVDSLTLRARQTSIKYVPRDETTVLLRMWCILVQKSTRFAVSQLSFASALNHFGQVEIRDLCIVCPE